MTTRRPFGSVVLSIGMFNCVKKPPVDENQTQQNPALRAAEKVPHPFVIPSGARNLSFFSWPETKERFLAPLGMTNCLFFPQVVYPGRIIRVYFFFETAAVPKIPSSCFNTASGCAASTLAVRCASVL